MNQFSDKEKELLVAFCDWNIRDCQKYLDKAMRYVAAGRPGKRSIDPKLQENLLFWQTLKTKFE